MILFLCHQTFWKRPRLILMTTRYLIHVCLMAASIFANRPASARDSQADHELVTAALLDLLENPKSLTFDQTTATKGKIVFAVPEFIPSLTSLTVSLESQKAFQALTPDIQSRIREAATNIEQRAADKDGYTTPTQLDGRIVVYNENMLPKEAASRFWERPQVFRPLPPGYSNDGTLALVRIHGTWSGNMHSVIFLTMFIRRNGKWVKLDRCDIFFV